MRNCSWCGNMTEEWCQHCIEAFEKRKPAHYMTGDERAVEMESHQRCEIPFNMIHQRIEELVGRPVWTHEMGLNWDGLLEEARTREHPSLDDVIQLVPEEKRIIVTPEILDN